MTLVERHIQYLVATTDCVIVPGWGGFIASRRPAYVEGSRFFPPRREVVFNPALSHDDGLLASSLCRREGMSYESARAAIDKAVGEMQNEYAYAGHVVIPRVGAFRRQPDGTMAFFPADRGVASAPYLFLPELELIPAADGAPAEDAAPEVNILPRESWAKKALRVAAFIAILLGLALTLSTPISVNLPSRPDFAAVGASPVAEEIQESEVMTFRIALPDSALAVAPVVVKPDIAPKAVDAAKYYLIIGSHDSRAKAESWMARHSDYAIGIIERGGKYRVYADTGNTIEEAMSMKNDPAFARANPEAWVYRRR